MTQVVHFNLIQEHFDGQKINSEEYYLFRVLKTYQSQNACP